MYERFTDRARKVMQLANQEAQRFNQEYIGTEHLLLGLVKEGSGVAANVLKNLDINLRKIRLEVEKIIPSGPDRITMGRLPQTPRVKQTLEYAIEEARNLNHNYVGTEHLLLGLMHDDETVAAQVLMNLGLNLADVRKEVLNLLGHDMPLQEKDIDIVYIPRSLMGTPRQENAAEKSSGVSAKNGDSFAEMRERIHALEGQLWNVRVVLGALAGALAGVLLAATLGAVLGLIIGGMVAAWGRRIPAALAGGIAGVLLDVAHLPEKSGGVAGALLGILTGILIAEIGEPARCCRGFATFRQRK